MTSELYQKLDYRRPQTVLHYAVSLKRDDPEDYSETCKQYLTVLCFKSKATDYSVIGAIMAEKFLDVFRPDTPIVSMGFNGRSIGTY